MRRGVVLHPRKGSRTDFPYVSSMHLLHPQQPLERAKQLAALRHSTLEALIKDIIDLLAVADRAPNPLLGMSAQEAALRVTQAARCM